MSSWMVQYIELSEPLRELSIPEEYAGVRLAFFWKGVPLGHQLLAKEQLPLTPEQVALIASNAVSTAAGDYAISEGFRAALPGLPLPQPGDPVAALGELTRLSSPFTGIDTQAATSLSVTAAICTRERPRELMRCLDSLRYLTDRPAETLVVDNAPVTGRTREVVAQYPVVRYIKEPRKGLSAARNAALAAARSDVVAFIDDDVVVHPQWLSRMRACFADPQVMLATGMVLPAELDTPAQLLFQEKLGFLHHGYRRRRFDAQYFARMRGPGVPVWAMGAGANMAVRRSVYGKGHRFDARLGPGVFGGCGEDSEFWYGILASGGTCVYDPRACVFHYHRRELSALRRLVREYMKGHVAALILQFMKYKHPGNLKRLFLRLPAEYVMIVLRLIVSGFALDQRILVRGGWGSLAGLRFVWTGLTQRTR